MPSRVLLEKPLRWIDVVAPTREELQRLAKDYHLHPTSVQDCLDPEHLPKIERIEDTLFIIVRGYDDRSGPDADTVQALTRKIALFLGPQFLISVQRVEQPYLIPLKEKCLLEINGVADIPVMIELLRAAVDSYERPLEDAEVRIEAFEVALFSERQVQASFQEIHLLKRRLSVIKRMLWHTTSVIQKINPSGNGNQPLLQDLKEEAESMFVFSDELMDDVNTLLNIQLSLSSHRMAEASNQTNEVMRVLTIFSAFFMPLTFIVGVYGMNFHNFPELDFHYGYHAVWGVMIATTVAVYFWFRHKGWMK